MPHVIHSRTETKRKSAPVSSKASSCGCASHEETCCQLDCITQPYFFGGQLLADTDLTQLLNWSKDKFRLSRFRDGWGVVCGLEVQYDSRSQAVRVGKGYALDCCGHDILVCEDKIHPLDDACSSIPEPCTVPEKLTRGHSADEGETIDFFGCPVPKKELHEKVLTIRYEEVPSDFETAFGYATPDGTANCLPSRMRESFTLAWVDTLAQQVEAHDRLEKEYHDCCEVLDKYRAWQERQNPYWSKESQRKGEDIKAWLLKWIDGTSGYHAHPLYQFGWLRDCIGTMDERDPGSLDQYVANLLFWMVQDCRNHTLQSTCSDCPDDHGVPLARVYLWVPRRENCKVLAIDPYPPYRRPLSLDSWPSPDEHVNIGKAIWQSPNRARDLLMKMGLTVASAESAFQVAADPDELCKDLECGPFVKRDEPVSLQVFDAGGRLGKRVVGVCSASSTNSYGKEEQALVRVVTSASEARERAEELGKKLYERDTQDKWGEEMLSHAQAGIQSTRGVEELVKKLRERGTHDKWEEEALVLADAGAQAARVRADEMVKKLRKRGTHDKWEEEALVLAEANAKAARETEVWMKKLRERLASPAKP